MKIAFDVQLLMKGNITGIGWCAENILQNIQGNQNEITLNCFTLGYKKEQYQNVEKYISSGYRIEKCTWFHDVLYRMVSNFIPIPYSLFFRKNNDITMFFNYVIPPGVKGKKATIIYDMAYKACPETVRMKTKCMLNLSLKKSCKRADKIITISEFSKQEIIHYLHIEDNKIVIMPIGVDFNLFHPNYSDYETNIVLAKYKISTKYFLYLGTLEPRKNITRLIEAYAKLKEEISPIPKLVLAGGKGWMYDSIFETVERLKLKDDIIFTGYVMEKEVPILMKGAEAFLFPSIYEGFGMPPLEAMACGTPVLVSNTASLPEVVGDAGIYVEPYSVQSIKEGMALLLNDEELKNKLADKGLERARLFTWERSAKIVNKVFEELL